MIFKFAFKSTETKIRQDLDSKFPWSIRTSNFEERWCQVTEEASIFGIRNSGKDICPSQRHSTSLATLTDDQILNFPHIKL